MKFGGYGGADVRAALEGDGFVGGALLLQPPGVLVGGPVVGGVVRPVKLVVAVVDAALDALADGGMTRGEMELARQPAEVPRIVQEFRH